MLRNCRNGNVLLQGAKREPCRVVEDIKRTLQHLLVKEAQKASDDGCIGMSATDVDMVRVLQQVVLDDTELFQTTERDGSVSAQSCLQLEQAAIPMGGFRQSFRLRSATAKAGASAPKAACSSSRQPFRWGDLRA